MLPPTADSLHQHKLRCNYQSHKWKQSLRPDTPLDPPVGHGWEVTEAGKLTPVLSSQPAVPTSDSVVEFTTFGCTSSKCMSKKCSCCANNLVCTPACKCMGEDGCNYPQKLQAQADNDTDSDSDDTTDYESDDEI